MMATDVPTTATSATAAAAIADARHCRPGGLTAGGLTDWGRGLLTGAGVVGADGVGRVVVCVTSAKRAGEVSAPRESVIGVFRQGGG